MTNFYIFENIDQLKVMENLINNSKTKYNELESFLDRQHLLDSTILSLLKNLNIDDLYIHNESNLRITFKVSLRSNMPNFQNNLEEFLLQLYINHEFRDGN